MFAARFAAQGRWQLAILFGFVGLMGFVDGWRLVNGAAKRSKRIATVEELSDQGGAVSGYLATYLLPFLGTLPQNAGDWVAYGLYFATALVVYIQSSLALVNPTLYALGYRLFRSTVDGQSTLIVSSCNLRSGDDVQVSALMDVLVVHRVCKTDGP
jgi:hypothetical protein